MKSSSSVNDIISDFDRLCLTNRLKEIRLRKQHLEQEEAYLQQLASPSSSLSTEAVTPIATAAIITPSPASILDTNNQPLAIGDHVQLQSSGRSGKTGDYAVVTGLGSFIQLKLVTTRTRTQRKSYNLLRVPHPH